MQVQSVIPSLHKYASTFHPVVPFKPGKDKLVKLDLSITNNSIDPIVHSNVQQFSKYIDAQIKDTGSRYGIGGYQEHRVIYGIHPHFNSTGEPRRLHLGIDIWGEAGTPIYAFMGGRVHSFAFNDHLGDYGATLILLHQLDGIAFHTLYGHISLKDIDNLAASQYVVRGQEIAHIGNPEENGQWPPHLHFQIIIDMELKQGDYPGVCKYSEKERYLYNCPDPDLILQMNRYTD